MGAKKKKGGIVYSTDPEVQESIFASLRREEDSITPSMQDLRIWRQRIKGNKTITLVKGLELNETDTKALAKELRQHCGTGGSHKDKEIILQGDHADKVCAFLKEKGYKAKRAGG